MTTIMDVLAKSNPAETLQEHIIKVNTVWEQIYNRYKPEIPCEGFWQYSLISTVFHDFGKVTNNFQDVIKGIVKNYDNYLRHEFISGMYLFANSFEDYKNNPLSLFAVFSHHKPLDLDLFSKETNVKLELDITLARDFIEWARTKIVESGFDFKSNDNLLKYFKNDYQKLYSDYKSRVIPLLYNINSDNRIDYINYKAILQISDWLASGNNSLLGNLSYDIKFLKNKILQKLNKERQEKNESILTSIKFRKFQNESDVTGNVIAVAPTGSGKTEAALIWAKNKPDFGKIIYLLPTKVTSNAIYQRLKFYFGTNNTAIVHSSAFFFRKEIEDNYQKKDYLLDKTFFKNINISTVDQLLTQGFNLGYWELKTFHQRKAKIIIDEIHLYEPYTLGLILATIKYLKEYLDASFYIMTATLPATLKDLLFNYLSDATLIEDRELLQQARNEFSVKEKRIEESIDDIVKYAKKGKKVLVVVNTVDAAISLYQSLKEKINTNEIDLLCYHSRFTILHRQEKEQKIFELETSPKSGILIATQVIEVSLDIDFDVLFSENAPIDAIIQRAGRVNRKRKKDNTKVVVFKHSEISEKWVYNTNDVLNKTWNILKKNNNKSLTEENLIDLVNEVYKDFNIEENLEFQKGLRIYSDEQQKLSFIMDNQANADTMTRLNMDTINVIPMNNNTTGENYMNFLENKKPFEIAKYEISIRKSKEFKFRIEPQGFYKYIDAYYDEEIGLDFKRKEPETTFM